MKITCIYMIQSIVKPERKYIGSAASFAGRKAEHEGVRLACAATGIDHRSISQVAAGSLIRKTAGGYLWKYKK